MFKEALPQKHPIAASYYPLNTARNQKDIATKKPTYRGEEIVFKTKHRQAFDMLKNIFV